MCQCSRYYWVAEASARVCKLVRLRLSVVRDVEGALGAGRKGTSRAWALRVRWMPPHSRTRGTTCRQGGGKARKGRTACGHAPRRGRKGWGGALLRQAGGSAALAKLAGLRPSSGAARGMGQCRTLDCYTLACRGVPRYKNNFSFLKIIKNIVKQVVKHSSLKTSLS